MAAPTQATNAWQIAIKAGEAGYINVIRGSLRFCYSVNPPQVEPSKCVEISSYSDAVEFAESENRVNVYVAKTGSEDVEYFVNLIDDETSGA